MGKGSKLLNGIRQAQEQAAILKAHARLRLLDSRCRAAGVPTNSRLSDSLSLNYLEYDQGRGRYLDRTGSIPPLSLVEKLIGGLENLLASLPAEKRQQLTRVHYAADCVLAIRSGDSYEFFFEDARLASALLGLRLIFRGKGKQQIVMCGFPYAQRDNVFNRLKEAGNRVICIDGKSEQEV